MEPVELRKNVWWIANRSDSLLEVNIYLLCYPHAKGQANIIIDPGPGELLTVLQKAVSPIIGGLENIHGVLINHQDPDVAPKERGIIRIRQGNLIEAEAAGLQGVNAVTEMLSWKSPTIKTCKGVHGIPSTVDPVPLHDAFILAATRLDERS
jgi:flavorubredoxin